MAEWYEQLLDRQLRENRDIWAQLEEHGIDDDSVLRLGFLYAAPGEPEARRLAEFLRAETDYEVDARARRAGLRPKAAWFVIGTTQPTAVSSSTKARRSGRRRSRRTRSAMRLPSG